MRRSKEVCVDDDGYMACALEVARTGARLGEVPVGALIVHDGAIVSSAYNLREKLQDPCAHAELLAIRQAAAFFGRWRLSGATLYVTLEPCIMCMGAAILARVDRIVFGAADPKGGAAGSIYDFSQDPRLNHRIELQGGVRDRESVALLKSFFDGLRARGGSKAGR